MGFSLSRLNTTELETFAQPDDSAENMPLYYCQRHGYRPLLAHVHIPKTGGISLRKLLDESFPNRCLGIDSEVRWGEYGNQASIHSQLLKLPQIHAVTSHLFRFNYPNILGDRLMLYFTLLREPVDQFKSCVRFMKYNYSQFGADVRRWLPARLPEMSLVEIADTFLHTASLDSCWFAPCRFLGLTNKSEPVIRRLMGFLLVGTFERMEESLQLLSIKLRPYGLSLNLGRLPHLNASRGTNFTGEPLPDDYAAQEHALDAYGIVIRSYYERHASAEFEVYEWACAQFDAQWRSRTEELPATGSEAHPPQSKLPGNVAS